MLLRSALLAIISLSFTCVASADTAKMPGMAEKDCFHHYKPCGIKKDHKKKHHHNHRKPCPPCPKPEPKPDCHKPVKQCKPCGRR